MRRPGSLIPLGLLVAAATAGCDDVGVEDCVSHYNVLVTAPSWRELKQELLDYHEHRDVVSLRILERGVNIGSGDQDARRIVKLVDERHRSVAQVEVWRTDSGGWRAGSGSSVSTTSVIPDGRVRLAG